MQLSERDKKIMWHPFTQEQTAFLPIAIKRASGSYLYDENDKAYLDLISSWWVNLHGHCNPNIVQAIYDQAQTLEHVMFAGFTHEPAVKYCEMLQKILPESLKRFFYSDNGSTAVETALKMAYQYWVNVGEKQRHLFVSFEGGYHGDTFGAMSVSLSSGFHDKFKDLFFEVLTVPFPETWQDDNEVESKEARALTYVDEVLKKNGHEIAAVIIEPLVQGAKGMRMCRPEFLKNMLQKFKEKGIFIIFDEVMTGFGRCGTNFALNQIGFEPDFLCLSKGITGGFLPLALTVTTEQVYSGFLSDKWGHALAHGHTYTANPIACRAAIESLKLLRNQTTADSIKSINIAHNEGINNLKAICDIIKPRVLGTIAAFETNGKNEEVAKKLLEIGLFIRPLGQTIYLLPPYSITSEELSYTYEQIGLAIR